MYRIDDQPPQAGGTGQKIKRVGSLSLGAVVDNEGYQLYGVLLLKVIIR